VGEKAGWVAVFVGALILMCGKEQEMGWHIGYTRVI